MSAAGNEVIQTAGINDVYEYNEIHLDSTQRDGGTNDHPTFDLSNPLSSVLGLKLLTAEIPWTVYNITASGPSQNNTYYVDGAARLVPPGFYDAPALLAALNALDANAWSFDSKLGKFSFKNNAGTPIGWGFQDHSLARVVGFDDAFINLSAGQTLQAPYVASVSGPNAVYLVSDSVGGRVSRNIRVNGSTSRANTAIAKIPVDVNPGETLFYRDPTPSNCYDMSMDNLTSMDMYLVDPYSGAPINLNGSPWSATFQILTQRDTSVSRMQSQLVKGRGSAVPGGKRLRVR